MSRLEGYSTWDSSNNAISIGPVQAPPADSTDEWYATYIDFEDAYNAYTHEIKVAFDADSSTIIRSLGPRDYSADNTMLMEWVRTMRNDLLAESDWTQVGDSPLTAEEKSQWQMYRQKLRDLPADFSGATTLEAVTFPEAPGS